MPAVCPAPPAAESARLAAAMVPTAPATSAAVPAAAPESTPAKPHCPRCQSARVQRYGTFRRKDGIKQDRFRCRDCGRTFSPHTGTPRAYLKKLSAWLQMPNIMKNWPLPLRAVAAHFNIHLTTAFRWRHKLLALNANPVTLPMSGNVQVVMTGWRYSQKGQTLPPSKRFDHDGNKLPPLFSLRDSAIIALTHDGQQADIAMMVRHRPVPDLLTDFFRRQVAADATVISTGHGPFALVCQKLGLMHTNGGGGMGKSSPVGPVVDLLASLYAWRKQLHGVATKYLHHYLRWCVIAFRQIRLLA